MNPQTTPRTARFWTFENDSWVKISVRPGESVTHRKFSRDDEGFSSCVTSWTHDGAGVTCEWTTAGRDCDGYSGRSGAVFAEMDRLASVQVENVMRPYWTEVEAVRCHDQFAELMGY